MAVCCVHYALRVQRKNCDDRVHRLVAPLYGTAAICSLVPEARAGRMEPRSILLHDRASDHVFELLVAT